MQKYGGTLLIFGMLEAVRVVLAGPISSGQYKQLLLNCCRG